MESEAYVVVNSGFGVVIVGLMYVPNPVLEAPNPTSYKASPANDYKPLHGELVARMIISCSPSILML